MVSRDELATWGAEADDEARHRWVAGIVRRMAPIYLDNPLTADRPDDRDLVRLVLEGVRATPAWNVRPGLAERLADIEELVSEEETISPAEEAAFAAALVAVRAARFAATPTPELAAAISHSALTYTGQVDRNVPGLTSQPEETACQLADLQGSPAGSEATDRDEDVARRRVTVLLDRS